MFTYVKEPSNNSKEKTQLNQLVSLIEAVEHDLKRAYVSLFTDPMIGVSKAGMFANKVVNSSQANPFKPPKIR